VVCFESYYLSLPLTSTSCSSDPPAPISCPKTANCETKVESALVGYIQLENSFGGKENTFGESDVDANNRPLNPNKRRRLDTPHDVNHDGNGNNDEEDGSDGASDITTEILSTAIETISNKIRKGLDEIKKQKGSQPQMEAKCTDVVTRDHLSSSDITPSDFNVHFALGELPIEARSLRLETIHWQQALDVLRPAHQTAWKNCFIAACLRGIRQQQGKQFCGKPCYCNSVGNCRLDDKLDC
jgi:hypothetical protein